MLADSMIANSSSDTKRAIALIGLGYTYILFVLLALVGAGVLLVRMVPGLLQFVVQFGIGYLVFLIEALWIRVPKPSGRKVSRAGSPKLIDEIEAIAKRLDAPLPDDVIVTVDLNAAAAELPRFGIFGAPKRYLLLGLPLIDALPPDELRAVIAHELAHLSRRHGRIHLLAVRIATSWQSLAMHIATARRHVSWLFLPFFRWYLPRLQMAADRLSRGHEHESDTLAGEAATPTLAGFSLIRLSVQNRRMRRVFLPSVLRDSADVIRAPSDFPARLEQFLRTPFTASEARPDVVAALEERTTHDDTHPSLRERLNTLGVPTDVEYLASALVDTGFRSAASQLIGERRLLKLREQLNPDLLAPLSNTWRELRSLVDRWRAPDGTVRESVDARVSYARWASQALPPAEAITLLKEALTLGPADNELALRLGIMLLDEEQRSATEEAIPILQEVAASDSSLALAACGLLRQGYLRVGDDSALSNVASRELELNDAHLDTLRERVELSADDDLEAASLAPAARAKLLAFLQTQPDVHRAFLVVKRTQYLKDIPLIVLALQRKVPWYKPESGKAAGELVQRVLRALDVGHAHGVVTVVEARSRILRKLRSIPNANLFDRSPSATLRPPRTYPWSRLRRSLPSVRLVLFVLIIVVAVWTRSPRQKDEYSPPRFDPRTQPAVDAKTVSPQADDFGRRFVHLLQTGRTDSLAGLLSATAHNPDSIAWARNLGSSVRVRNGAKVERILGLEARRGTVTRDVLVYAVTSTADTATVLIFVVEELGVRAVEAAEVVQGRPDLSAQRFQSYVRGIR